MYQSFGLLADGGLFPSSSIRWDIGSEAPAATSSCGPDSGLGMGAFPVCSGQEPDPTCGWRQCEAELHRAGWREAMHRDGVRRTASLRVSQPHRQAQSDGEATGISLCVDQA